MCAAINFRVEQVYEALAEVAVEHQPTVSDRDDSFGDRIVPRDLRQWLARLRLLLEVPFAYLVSDSELLPPESIRFFYLDRSWTDALIEGALSVGTVNSSDRAQLEQLYRRIRDEIDEEERQVRVPERERAQKGGAGPISGFLMRSRAVSGWPGMHVRAYRREVGPDDQIQPESHPDRIKVLRLERLAPAVLLALFDGIPEVVHVEEPRQGVQFGVRLRSTGAVNRFNAFVKARDGNTSTDVQPPKEVPVFFRPGSPGVVDMRRTARKLIETSGTNIGPAVDSAEYALQMLRFPYRQVFGDPRGTATAIDSVFRPTVGFRLPDLEARFREATS